jgi:hypothetical protein
VAVEAAAALAAQEGGQRWRQRWRRRGARDEAAHNVVTQDGRVARRESGQVEALLLELGGSPIAALMPSRFKTRTRAHLAADEVGYDVRT